MLLFDLGLNLYLPLLVLTWFNVEGGLLIGCNGGEVETEMSTPIEVAGAAMYVVVNPMARGKLEIAGGKGVVSGTTTSVVLAAATLFMDPPAG